MATEQFMLTSIDISLSGDLTEVGEQFDTMLDVISDCGGVYEGFTIIFTSLLYFWSSFKHDSSIAKALLLEKRSPAISKISKGGVKRNRDSKLERGKSDAVKTKGGAGASKGDEIQKWARKHFESRVRFKYPGFFQLMCSRCCSQRRAVLERIRFAQSKLHKELDLVRFISQ